MRLSSKATLPPQQPGLIGGRNMPTLEVNPELGASLPPHQLLEVHMLQSLGVVFILKNRWYKKLGRGAGHKPWIWGSTLTSSRRNV